MKTIEEIMQRVREWFDRALAELRSRAGDRPRRAASEVDREIDSEATVLVATRDDDVASIVGRIDTAETSEVVLVVRGEARQLRRPAAWPHIAAHARRRGVALGVVSARRDVRTFARQNGLRAGRSVSALQPRPYVVRVGSRDVVVPPVPWGKIVQGSMMLAVLVAALVVGCFEVPSAQVTVVPRAEAFEVLGEARPNAIIDASDLDSGTILATTIRRQVHTAVTTSTTGEAEVGDARASLELRFTNDGTSVLQVPVNTRVQDADGVGFITTGSVDVPAGGEAVVPANAEFPGDAGNIPVGTATEVEGLPATLTVTNSTAGTGGTNRLTAAVSQADVDRVREIATEILQRIALNTLLDEVEDGTLITTSVSVAIFSEQPVQLLDEPSDILIVDYVITAAALVVTDEEASRYGAELIRRELPEGIALIPGSVATVMTIPEEQGGLLGLAVSGQIAELSEIAAVASELTGKSISGARSYLSERLDLLEPPDVEVSPNFIPWLWLPRRADHIDVIIAGPNADEEEAEGESDPSDPDATQTADAEATETAAP